MELPTTFENLVEEATQLDLYKKLVLQLNKDFLYANIDLDFDEDIYGAYVQIHFVQRLRDEKKFNGLVQLKEAISNDVAHAREIFSET